MNILYIGTTNTVQNLKFINYFKENGDNVFALNEKMKEPIKNDIKKNDIKILKSIYGFSFIKFHQTIISIIKLNYYIYKNKIDIIHFLYSAPYSLWAIFIFRPYVITTRGSDALISLPQLQISKNLKNKILFWLFKNSFKKARFITCTSYKQADKLKEIFNINNNILVVRTGLDIEKILNTDYDNYLPEELINKKYVFLPRRFNPIYNHELEIEAIKLLDLELIKKYCFVFIKGFNYNKEYFERLSNELEKIDELKFIIFDEFSQQQMWSIYKNAKLTIMVPHSDGTPNSALEAMILNSPLILGNFDLDKDIFENCCFKMKTKEPTELKNLILNVFNEYPESFLEEAKLRVITFADRNKEMNKLKIIYDKIKSNKV